MMAVSFLGEYTFVVVGGGDGDDGGGVGGHDGCPRSTVDVDDAVHRTCQSRL